MKKTVHDFFEVFGYFFEYIDADSNKFYGTKTVSEKDGNKYPLGYDGKRYMTFEKTVLLDNKKKIKASVKKPVRVMVMTQALCGRVK